MNLHFAQPAWLISIVLVPLLVVGAILTARLRKKQWSAFVSPRLRPKLLRRGSPVPRWLALGFLMLAFILLAFTLARPQTKLNRETETTRGRNVLITLDLSRSMLAQDLKPDRLTQAKALCSELIDAMPTDRIAVVGFAGEPYLFAPLTVDHASVKETIDQLTIDSIPVQGSNLSSALKMGMKTLKETGQKENALILLTDGEETTEEIDKLADKAKEMGIYIFAVAFGTEQGAPIPDPAFRDGQHRDRSGHVVNSKLSTKSLIHLANQTGGRFVVATSAADIPNMVAGAMKDMEQFEIAGRERVVPTEHFQWFLLPAILLLTGSILAGTRWRRPSAAVAGSNKTAAATATTAAATLLLLISAQPSKAAIDDYGRKLLKDGQNKEAAQEFGRLADQIPNTDGSYRFRLAQGTAAYRANDLNAARHAFSEAMRSPDLEVRAAAHHGMGNILFESGWRNLSDDVAYPGTYKPKPKKEDGGLGIFERILDALLGRNRDKPEEKDHADSDPMAPFDEMIGLRIKEWMKEEVEEGQTTEGYNRFDSVITDWIDAVKHYDSAVTFDPRLEDARTNRALTVKYLKRLRDILDQVQQSAKMMGAGSGQGDQDDDQEGDGSAEGSSGNNGKQRRRGKGGQEQRDKDQKGPGDEKKDKDGKGKGDDQKKADGTPRKGETEQDAARRILKENADFEKGAPTKGRIDYGQPDKDW